MFRTEISPLLDKRLALLSTALISLYVIRITILARWISPIAPYLIDYGGYTILILSMLILFVIRTSRLEQRNVIFFLSLILIVISVFFSDEFEFSLIRTILWLLVFMVAGPLFSGAKIAVYRNYLWVHFKVAVITITMLSFAWYVLRLPIYGKGMAGVTVHSILLGAIAGISMILIFATAIHFRKPYLHWPMFFVSFITCLLAASRVAVLAGCAGCLAVLVFQVRSQINQVFLLLSIVILSLAVWTFFDLGASHISDIYTAGQLSEYTQELAIKGFVNTRDRLWSNRLIEFENNPFFGVGIGVDTFAIRKDSLPSGAVEPGSSYLTVLSMTGIFGAGGLLLLFASLGGRFWSRIVMLTTIERAQFVGVGTFWAIHAVAEGWIFAGGSILCLFFWIWVGRLASLGNVVPIMLKSQT
jgi:hypothetical protein